MQLKRVCVNVPVPYSSSVDKTLVADPKHGRTLVLDGEFVVATSEKGVKWVPLQNVSFLEPLLDDEPTETNTAPVPAKPFARFIDDTVKYTKKDGKVAEVK
jgi:hypothetical protein